jgi:NAD-dependent dihydropyrimidine dehydrogenase PreA subunit
MNDFPAMSGKGNIEQPYPTIIQDECKGCGRCIHACPQNVLELSDHINVQGYRTARYTGGGCSGCAICFYNCPEPFAIEVYTPDKEGRA